MAHTSEIQRDVDFVLSQALLDYNRGDADDLTLLEIIETYERLSRVHHPVHLKEHNKSQVYLSLLNFKKQ
jgi:hypothetical protein